MGVTTVTHMFVYGPMSWNVLGPNIVWITGKTVLFMNKNLFRKSTTNNNKENIWDLMKTPDGVAKNAAG